MGSDPQPAQIIPAPPPPQGSGGGYGQTADEIAQSRLKNDPLLAQQSFETFSKFLPQYYQQISQVYPQIGTLSGQVQQQLTSPTGLTPEQQAAQDAIRGRAYEQSDRGVRSAANVGGTLYGGQSQLREDRARNELSQGFATQDIALQDARRRQTMSELAQLLQISFPNVQQPSIGGNPDALYAALVQNAGNFGITQPTPGQIGGGTAFLQGFGTGLGGSMCLPENTKIETLTGERLIRDLDVGDEVLGGTVLAIFKQRRAPDHRFYLHRIDGREVVMSRGHPFEGTLVSAELVISDSPCTHDILTTSGRYRINGCWIHSTLRQPELAEVA